MRWHLCSWLLTAILAAPLVAQPTDSTPNSPSPPYGTFFSLHPPGKQPLQDTPGERQIIRTVDDRELAQMVAVPAGLFVMGADDGFADERPQRQVYVKRFFIDKYEVTNRQFHSVGLRPVRAFGARYEAPYLPVVGVSWLQARAYCTKLGKRLPTEAEWEKAARGADARSFPWGNFWDPALANDGRGPRPVGSYPEGSSPYGARDMAGNVWEWVEDRYAWREVEKLTHERRVLRGGSWNYAAVFMRTTYRRHERPDYVEHRIGFRCARAKYRAQ